MHFLHSIVLGCRRAEKAAKARRELERETGRAIFETFPLDLADVAAVRASVAVSSFAVDDLVMNAGGTGGPEPLALTADGVTEIFAGNVLGHVVLFDELARAGRLRRNAVYVGSEGSAKREGP